MHSPTKESPPVYKKEETKGSKNITPPTSFNGQLPSPESLGRKESRARPGQFLKAPTHSDSALEVFRRCLETGQIPWQEFKVRREDYVEVIGLIVGDERLRRFRPRFDYTVEDETLVVRMTPSVLHEQFLRALYGHICDRVKELQKGRGVTARFAKNIRDIGHSTFKFKNSDDHSPDGQLIHTKGKFPGVILEVAYSGTRKNLGMLAEHYIVKGCGSIRVVIGIDLEYGKNKNPGSRKATLTVWRPKFVTNENNKKTIIPDPVVRDEPFRDDRGRAVGSGLRFHLSDVVPPHYAEEVLGGSDEDFYVPSSTLRDFLKDAEECYRDWLTSDDLIEHEVDSDFESPKTQPPSSPEEL